MKNTFTLGIRSTQLAESLNSDIKDRLRCDINMEDFFVQFDSVISDKRLNERASEFYARQKLPHESMNRSPLLRQAAKIYTPKISLLFQKEFDKSLEAFKYHRGQYENQFIITSLDVASKEFKVYFNRSRDVITCSCRLFEMEGILCHHILKVFSKEDVYKIPEKYFFKRWSRGAKSWYSLDEDVKEGEDKNGFINRMNSMLLRALYHGSNSTDSYKGLESMVIDFCKRVFDNYPIDVAQQVEGSTQDLIIKGTLKKKEGKQKTRRQKPLHEQRQGKNKRKRVEKVNITFSLFCYFLCKYNIFTIY